MQIMHFDFCRVMNKRNQHESLSHWKLHLVLWSFDLYNLINHWCNPFHFGAERWSYCFTLSWVIHCPCFSALSLIKMHAHTCTHTGIHAMDRPQAVWNGATGKGNVAGIPSKVFVFALGLTTVTMLRQKQNISAAYDGKQHYNRHRWTHGLRLREHLFLI